MRYMANQHRKGTPSLLFSSNHLTLNLFWISMSISLILSLKFWSSARRNAMFAHRKATGTGSGSAQFGTFTFRRFRHGHRFATIFFFKAATKSSKRNFCLGTYFILLT